MNIIQYRGDYCTAEEIAEYLGARPSGDGWIARCPAHDDYRPSLSIGEGDDGRTLLHCFAGCSIGDITRAMGIEVKELFPPDPTYEGREVEDVYQYTDEDGNVLYEVVRFFPKGFMQRRPDPSKESGYVWETRGVRRVLYGLKYLKEDIEKGDPIFIVEGEKDVHTMWKLGLAATTIAGGAGAKWLPEYTEALRGADVIVLPDNDKTGREFAQKVANALYGKVKSLCVVELPGLPEKGDISDWIDMGHTLEELRQIVSNTPEWQPTAPVEVINSPATYFVGNKISFKRIGDDILARERFFTLGGQIYVYENGVYRPEGKTKIQQMVIDMLGDEYRKHYVEEVLYYIAAKTAIRDSEVNTADDGYINVKNGLLNWRTGELIPHTPDRLSTIQIPVKYDPDAKAERVPKFFEEVLPEDTIPIAEELFGYAMIPTTKYHKAFMLTGVGRNGKSVFIDLLNKFIGEDNISNVELQDLDGNRFKLAQLHGKLLNTFADISAKALVKSSIFKSVVSGDRLSAEYKGVDSFDFRPFARLVFSANEIPRTNDVTDGFFRRWIIIPFPRRFEEGANADPDLLEKLTTERELSGLLNIALEGLRRLDANRAFTVNETTRQALEQYRKDSDNVAAFIEECCIVKPDARVNKPTLYKAYSEWVQESGLKPFSRPRFYKRLAEVVNVVEKRPDPRSPWCFEGIGLLSDQPDMMF